MEYFKSPLEMVTFLMNTREKEELVDSYGRRWKYNNYKFYFKDIGRNSKFREGIDCLHLYGTNIKMKEVIETINTIK